MHSLSEASAPLPLETVIDRLAGELENGQGDTISSRIGGGIPKLLLLLGLAGYRGLEAEGLGFDCSVSLDGNEILLVHSTRVANSGEWGLVWRSEWDFASLPFSDLGDFVRTIDAGVQRLAGAASQARVAA
jgi:hypothetical protein